MIRFVFGLLFLVSSFSLAQISTEIDTARIKIGQPIAYKLIVPINPKDEIQMPVMKDTLSFHIEVLDQKLDTLFEGEKRVLVQHISLTSFEPGQFLIRGLPVVINSDTLLSASHQIWVEDVEIDSTNLDGFPIKPIMNEKLSWKDYWDKYWLYFIIGGLLFLIFLTVAILFFRNNKYNKVKSYFVKTPYEEARDSLKNLDKKKLIENGDVYGYYSELSHILRRYIGRVYHFSSLEMLSDDLVRHVKQTTQLDKAEIEKLKEFLYVSDLVKFAKSVPEKEKHQTFRTWIDGFVELINPMDIPEEELPKLRPNEKYREIK